MSGMGKQMTRSEREEALASLPPDLVRAGEEPWCRACIGRGYVIPEGRSESPEVAVCRACNGTGLPPKPDGKTCDTCKHLDAEFGDCLLAVDELAKNSGGKWVRINGEPCQEHEARTGGDD